MWNNFRKTAVLKKISIVNLSYKAKDCPFSKENQTKTEPEVKSFVN